MIRIKLPYQVAKYSKAELQLLQKRAKANRLSFYVVKNIRRVKTREGKRKCDRVTFKWT